MSELPQDQSNEKKSKAETYKDKILKKQQKRNVHQALMGDPEVHEQSEEKVPLDENINIDNDNENDIDELDELEQKYSKKKSSTLPHTVFVDPEVKKKMIELKEAKGKGFQSEFANAVLKRALKEKGYW
ncbi:hypothetical protein [Fictibacillus sp. NRS-1165]|uniref:hypothetical protein n=1 Tax=Fictibacillus sp. NRS-1165 TaxID=3144463 RepID=UPI003D21E752